MRLEWEKWLSVSYALMATCCGGNNFGVNAKVREADHALKLRRVEDIKRGGSLCVKRIEGNVPIRSKGHEEFGS